MRRGILICAAAGLIAAAALGASQAGASGEPQGRIVGGAKAEPSRWGFTAALFYNGRFGCGGSVVAPDKVLTAAHCVVNVPKRILRVVTGRPNLRKRSVGQRIPVSGYKVHPSFKRGGRFDLAILTLAEDTVSVPIELATPSDAATAIRPGRRGRVAGWGSRNPFGTGISVRLRKTNEFVRPNRRCGRTYGMFNGRTMICALGSRRRPLRFFHRSACSGDSGGPYVSDALGEPKLIGVVSFGGPLCGDRAFPSVYVRVPAALGWILPRI